MATQLQEYNGRNCNNNKVVVDYEKRTVRFKPVKDGVHPYRALLTNLIAISTYKSFVVLLTLFIFALYVSLIQGFGSETLVITFGTIFFVVLFVNVFFSFLFSIPYFNKDWREKHFSES